MQNARNLPCGLPQPRNHFGCRETQYVADSGGVACRRILDGRGRPLPFRARCHEVAGGGFDGVDVVTYGVCALVESERFTQTGQSLCATPQLACAQHRENEIDLGVVDRGFAEDMQSVADLNILDLAQPAVDVQQHVVEDLFVGPLGEAEVVIHLRGGEQRPDLLANRGEFRGIESRDVRVLVEELFESCDVAVGFGPRHGRDQVVDEHRVRSTLGLGALARVVDQERIDQRDVAERGIGAALCRHSQRLARQPLEVAVFADVHDRVGAEARDVLCSTGSTGEPAIGGEVVMRGRKVGVVIDRDRILTEPARRLHHDRHIAECQCCDDDLAVGALRSIDKEIARRRPPVLFDAVPQFLRQRREPPLVVGGADANRVGSQGLLGQPVGVLAATVDDRVDQCVRIILSQTGNRVRPRFRADVVACRAQRIQQT